MKADVLLAFALRVAGANRDCESVLLRDALALVEQHRHQAEFNRLEQLLEATAHLDCAALLHAMLLPAHGFEVGRAHPGAATQGFAGSWRKGDAYMPTFYASTPALALLRATFVSLARFVDTGPPSTSGKMHGSTVG